MIIEKVTLHAGTCIRDRVIAYNLDSSSWNHGAMRVEERLEYLSDHREGYTPCRHMHKE